VSLASKLKELRVRNNESLQEVAKAVVSSKAHIWELESGKPVNPSLELLKRLADHFKVSVAFLIGESAEGADKQLLKMFRNLGELNERDRALVEDIINGMKKRPPTE
jgi:transcriptional regulator with XRE-family HTH domain